MIDANQSLADAMDWMDRELTAIGTQAAARLTIVSYQEYYTDHRRQLNNISLDNCSTATSVSKVRCWEPLPEKGMSLNVCPIPGQWQVCGRSYCILRLHSVSLY